MGCISALVSIPFVTLPSIVYGITLFALVLPISLIIRPFTGGVRSAVIGDAIAVKLAPIVLVIVLPIVFYFYVWEPLGWIFLAWMILYFIFRRFSGVSEKHAQLDQTFKEFGRITREFEDKTRNTEETDADK